MEHAHELPGSFPWRTATVVVGAIAAVELVALVTLGALRLVPAAKHARVPAPAARAAAAAPVRHVPPAIPAVPTHRLKPRSATQVLVLNGNGRQGAAGSEAVSLQTLGYAVAGAENAPKHNYAQTMVMYVPGFLPEARRLARDAGIRVVAPLDGLRPGSLRGSKLVVLLGS